MEASAASERSFPLIGDCIGCESCVEVMPLIGGSPDSDSADRDRNLWVRTRPRRVTQAEYPPPIPFLARTGNLRWRMPWVLRRHYTSDGRLILREERVRHHEYFQAHRSGDRLTLQLLPLEDNGFELPINNADPDDDENNLSDNYLRSKEDIFDDEEEEDTDDDGDNNNGADFDDNKEQSSSVPEKETTASDQMELTETTSVLSIDNGGGSGDQWKCLYNTMNPSSSCIFGMTAVHVLGPVLG